MNRKQVKQIAKKSAYREIFQYGDLIVAELKNGEFLVAKQMEEIRQKLRTIAK